VRASAQVWSCEGMMIIEHESTSPVQGERQQLRLSLAC
jgi:hypothetical protein